MLYDLTSLRAIRIVTAGDGPSLIINRDQTDTVLIGDDNSVVTTGQNNVTIIDPLGTIAVTGDRDVWAATITGIAVVDVQQGATYWTASPAQIAAQIAAAGIFVNTNSTQIVNSGNKTLAPFTSLALPAVNFNQIGYEIRIASSWTSTPTDDFQFGVKLDWYDTTSGTIVDTDIWFVGASRSPSPALVIAGSGPTKGNQLIVTLINNDTPANGTVVASVIVLVNSRTYNDDKWFWQNNNPAGITFSHYTVASNFSMQQNSLNPTNVVGEVFNTIGANQTVNFAFGLFTGRVGFSIQETQGIGLTSPYGALVWQFMRTGLTGPLDPFVYYEPEGYTEFISVRWPMAVSVHNTTANPSVTASATLVGLD